MDSRCQEREDAKVTCRAWSVASDSIDDVAAIGATMIVHNVNTEAIPCAGSTQRSKARALRLLEASQKPMHISNVKSKKIL